MTRDEIRQMAREAELHCHIRLTEHGLVLEDLQYFAGLVAAAEREALAKHFEHLSGTWFAEEVAKEIRARGN